LLISAQGNQLDCFCRAFRKGKESVMKLISAGAAVRPQVNRIQASSWARAAVPVAHEVRSEREQQRSCGADWLGDRSESAQMSRKFSAFAGSGANARALVTGLRMGHAIVLDMPDAGGEQGSLIFVPLTGRLSHGNVYLVLAIAERFLAGAGVTSPTPQQIETVLDGGFLAITQDGVTRYVFAPGVLKLHSRGQCWRSIAHAHGLIPGSDADVRGVRNDAASNDVVQGGGARYVAGSVAPAVASLVFALSLSLGVQSRARANLDVSQNPVTPSKLFQKLDTDHDGYVSRAEAKKLKDFSGAFDDADENHDGKLSPAEFVKAESMYERTKAAEYIDDSVITAKVKAGLLKDPEVSALDVGVETYKGRVLLSGFVDSREQIRKAKRIASAVRGVQAVQDSLLVK
jgi:hyperosmotically inducible protein